MRHRHAISDASWERIKDLLPGRPGLRGRTALDNRRFDRWAKKGVWKAVFETLQDPDLEWLILDSTVIRAHPHAAGAKKRPMGQAARMRKSSAAVGADSAPRSTSG